MTLSNLNGPSRLTHYLNLVQTALDKSQLANRIAQYLLVTHHIPGHESSLVPWLTEEDCHSNKEALTHWVTKALLDMDEDVLEETTFHTLCRQLSEQLQYLLAELEH